MIRLFRKHATTAPGVPVAIDTEEKRLRLEVAILRKALDNLQRDYDALYALNQMQANIIDDQRGLREAANLG